jgi:NADH-quinone oxidoreductase subunit C
VTGERKDLGGLGPDENKAGPEEELKAAPAAGDTSAPEDAERGQAGSGSSGGENADGGKPEKEAKGAEGGSRLSGASGEGQSGPGVGKAEETQSGQASGSRELRPESSVKPEAGQVKESRPAAAAGEEKPVPRKPAAGAAGRARPAAGARPRPAAAAKKAAEPEEPSPMQPLLDKFVSIIKEKVSPESVEEALINRPSGHVPTLVVRREHWLDVARLLRDDPELSFDYLRLMSSVDYETHLEVVYQFYSFVHGHQLAVRVKTDREESTLPSVSGLWKAADWNEREAYDLMGIRFEGHPDLRRILLPDDWVGHPLRKDYEPLDQEV